MRLNIALCQFTCQGAACSEKGLTGVSHEPWGSDNTCSVGVTGRTLLLLSVGLWADFFDSVLLFPRMNPEGKPRINILGSWIILQVQQAYLENKSCDNWVGLPPRTAHPLQLRGSGEANSVDFRDPAQHEMPSHFQLSRGQVYIQTYLKNSQYHKTVPKYVRKFSKSTVIHINHFNTLITKYIKLKQNKISCVILSRAGLSCCSVATFLLGCVFKQAACNCTPRLHIYVSMHNFSLFIQTK